MKVTFNIDFHTRIGQYVFVVGSTPELGKWNESKALVLKYIGHGKCEGSVEFSKRRNIKYRYFVKDEINGELVYERGAERILIPTAAESNYFIKDFWKSFDGHNSVYNSSLFTNVLHKRENSIKHATKDSIILQLSAPSLAPKQTLYICGNQEELGYWNPSKALPMNVTTFPLWRCSLKYEKLNFPIAYKYLIKDENGNLITWEEGENRVLYPCDFLNFTHLIQSDENLRIYTQKWRGAGVSIPVFSLRTENSYGVGEFLDLKEMVDWAKKVGMNMIQVLPINDTTITHTWEDSYPYKPISVFALHPMYLNIKRLKNFTTTEEKKYEQEKKELNALDTVDYETVNKQKMKYIRIFFNKQKNLFFKDKTFQTFFKKNKDWLEPYAAFCYLRDKNGTTNFSTWGKYATYSRKKVTELTDKSNRDFEEIAIHYYIQFHLDLQLKEAVSYARKHNVALKGDIPIGIGGESVDAWTQPNLFNLGTSAGAPPDSFAIRGQNWGFPTYNWDEMGKDNYSWWKQRFQKMADYFDAYRIDHILGFFRIWEISADASWGLLGHFKKALPFSKEELQQRGFWLNEERHCTPYIREHILPKLFGDKVAMVKELFLTETNPQTYKLKEDFNTQKKIESYFNKNTDWEGENHLKDALMSLPTEVLFIADPINKQLYHPRISLHSTLSYKNLSWEEQQCLNAIYTDFFYHRNESFWWEQAMEKLPTLVGATDMLVCGEDLGMVPNCVPDVMWQLKILSLEIQRMPKSNHFLFGNPANAPYLSVCTTSTHDMSTIRGWWEEDRKASQKFYNMVLGKQGDAPYFAEWWLCEDILKQHLHSPAILTVFPLQDLLAIDCALRVENPHSERINIPSNPKHYWRYRMQMNLSVLNKADDFNTHLLEMVRASGR